MIGDHKILGALMGLVKQAKADAISVCAQTDSRRVFRFAHEAIHQGLVQDTVSVTMKVVQDGRVGTAGTGTLEPASLRRTLRAAVDIATHSPKRTDLPDLPSAAHIRSRSDYAPATAKVAASTCVHALKRLVQRCQGAGAALAGSLVTGETEVAVVNSAGTSCYTASTIAGAKLVTMYGSLSGFASRASRRFDRLDLDGLLKESLRQCLHRDEPVAVPVGTYEVILQPEAVATLLDWLGWIAFGAKSVQERTSFLAGRMGEQVMSPSLTIYDDGREAGSLRMPFDFEGVPKQRVTLIDRGRAVGLVYDTIYGRRFGHPSTGHCLGLDSTEGPFPLHLAIAPGSTQVPELIRHCKRGLLIPRFHYVNGLLNPREALMTGLTREGTFLIENGKLISPVRTLRFTQSILEAFSHVRGVSKARRLVADPSTELGCALVPALHLAAFRFTGRSEAAA